MTALDPRGVLRRGYAIVQHDATGATVRSASQVSAGDTLTVQVSDGAFGAEVMDAALDKQAQSL